jgi:hypothetical protein
MDIIIGTFFVGVGMIGAFIVSNVLKFKRKPKRTDPPSYHEDGSYEFQSHEYHTCPKCTMAWCYKSGHTYCECEEYHSGHFHLECKGTRDGVKNAGCKFKYIMRTK